MAICCVHVRAPMHSVFELEKMTHSETVNDIIAGDMLTLRDLRELVQEQGPGKLWFVRTWRVCISNLINFTLVLCPSGGTPIW